MHASLGLEEKLLVCEPLRSQFGRFEGCFHSAQQAFKLSKQRLVLLTRSLNAPATGKAEDSNVLLRPLPCDTMMCRWVPDEIGMKDWAGVGACCLLFPPAIDSKLLQSVSFGKFSVQPAFVVFDQGPKSFSRLKANLHAHTLLGQRS
jgi:hypothetical protein